MSATLRLIGPQPMTTFPYEHPGMTFVLIQDDDGDYVLATEHPEFVKDWIDDGYTPIAWSYSATSAPAEDRPADTTTVPSDRLDNLIGIYEHDLSLCEGPGLAMLNDTFNALCELRRLRELYQSLGAEIITVQPTTGCSDEH